MWKTFAFCVLLAIAGTTAAQTVTCSVQVSHASDLERTVNYTLRMFDKTDKVKKLDLNSSFKSWGLLGWQDCSIYGISPTGGASANATLSCKKPGSGVSVSYFIYKNALGETWRKSSEQTLGLSDGENNGFLLKLNCE
jgi:hypothetical protein